MRASILVPALVVFALAGCGKSDDQSKAEQPAHAQGEAAGAAANRAKAALQDAGASAADAATKLGEAGKAAAKVVQEQAPAIGQKLGEAGSAAKDAAAKLGDAGKAAAQAVQERVPPLQQKLGAAAEAVQSAADDAGKRLENAGDALLNDPDGPPLDEEDDAAEPDDGDPGSHAGADSPDTTGSITPAPSAAPAH